MGLRLTLPDLEGSPSSDAAARPLAAARRLRALPSAARSAPGDRRRSLHLRLRARLACDLSYGGRQRGLGACTRATIATTTASTTPSHSAWSRPTPGVGPAPTSTWPWTAPVCPEGSVALASMV